jgi:hypothetical protein
MPALVMALVANSKMLPHRFLPNAMQRTPAINNINHLDFIPDGPEFASHRALRFRLRIWMSRMEERKRSGRLGADIAQTDESALALRRHLCHGECPLRARTAAPCHARALTYASSGRRRSAAAKLGWIIVGRWVVVVGPQTTRNGVIAIDPHTIRSGVAWDHGLAGTNDDMLRSGMMPCCGGVRRSTESDQKA